MTPTFQRGDHAVATSAKIVPAPAAWVSEGWPTLLLWPSGWNRYVDAVAGSWSSRPKLGTPLDAALRRLVVVFRILGWLWMSLLVVLTLAADAGANQSIVVGSAITATLWTGVVVLVAARTNYLGSWWFVVTDGVVVLGIGAASTVSGAEDLFHGGYLIAWLVLAAYGGGRLWALGGAVLLTVEQVVVHVADGRGLVATGGSVVFFIFAYVVGWTTDSLRKLSAERTAALEALEEERAASVRADERARLADQMHDTVLQTLHALRLSAEEPDEVRYLSRQQERELRREIATLRSPYERSYRVALLSARDEVEGMYKVEIDPVLRSDTQMSEQTQVLVDAAREALLNAAAHSGATKIDLFSEDSESLHVVYVKDRGSGFDLERLTPHRGMGRAITRIEQLGGTVEITSIKGEGTECTITLTTT